MQKITSIIFISLLTASCSTQPYVRYKSPAINGKLLINEIAASNIPVFLSLDASDTECAQFTQRSTTNDLGRFLLPAEKQQMSYTPLMTYYLDEWTVCAEINGERRLIYSNNHYGMSGTPHAIRLSCHIPSKNNQSPCQQTLDE